MTKKFAIGVSIVLVALGFFNFFVPVFKAPILQALLHIAFGALGIFLSLRERYIPFIKWLGIISIILAALGFMGLKTIFGQFNFGLFNYWFYLVIGLACIWVYISEKQTSQN